MSFPLEYRGVTKRYPRNEQPAANAIDLKVEQGELLALVGASGSGKTTLLRLAAGLEVPDGGEVVIGGEIVAGDRCWIPPERRSVGMVFQDGALFPHYTAADNVAYGLRKQAPEERSEKIREMLDLVGLTGMEKRYPHELSGGERQRLAVARALAPGPAVILLDEPFSNLDPALRRDIREEVRVILQRLEATAIIVTHDTDDALAMVDRIAVMQRGILRQSGTPTAVYHHPVDGYCARLIGPANACRRASADGASSHPDEWLRPEAFELVEASTAGAIKVEILSVHDSGNRVEARVAPADDHHLPEQPAPGDEAWLLHFPAGTAVLEGESRWVRINRR